MNESKEQIKIEPNPYHCTPYVEDADADNCVPCKCPVCGAFLAWDKTGEIPICNNCGAELAKIPKQKGKWICCKCGTANQEDVSCSNCEHDKCDDCEEPEEDEDVYSDGKICVLSGPKWSKEERREKRRQRREQKNQLKKQRLERRKERAQKELEAAQKKIEALK